MSQPTAQKPKRWQYLIDVASLEPNDATPVELGNRVMAVYDTNEGIFVSDARCTHAGANLCDGYFDGKYIECPLHQGLFDATTGKAVAAPVTRNLRLYENRTVDGKLQILV
ncbi:naphthalene 1,2-dioxygenase [Chromatiales bacterium (ex Bugula neritina AB1)]|nr:naphthalene 1,2-dioxygenase [Chromatiales bacterium (ex Bugula neritina AB1)]